MARGDYLLRNTAAKKTNTKNRFLLDRVEVIGHEMALSGSSGKFAMPWGTNEAE